MKPGESQKWDEFLFGLVAWGSIVALAVLLCWLLAAWFGLV